MGLAMAVKESLSSSQAEPNEETKEEEQAQDIPALITLKIQSRNKGHFSETKQINSDSSQTIGDIVGFGK